MSAAVLAAGQAGEAVQAAAEGESSSFLVPNGTFFVVLAIFLTVLGVISVFVVPPIMKVLRERENMVTKTLADNKRSAEQFAAAEADYEEAMSAARTEASAVRDNARAEGRTILEDMRARAGQEVAVTLQGAGEQLTQEGDAVAGELRTRVQTLSTTLAGRVLGVDIGTAKAATTATGR